MDRVAGAICGCGFIGLAAENRLQCMGRCPDYYAVSAAGEEAEAAPDGVLDDGIHADLAWLERTDHDLDVEKRLRSDPAVDRRHVCGTAAGVLSGHAWTEMPMAVLCFLSRSPLDPLFVSLSDLIAFLEIKWYNDREYVEGEERND